MDAIFERRSIRKYEDRAVPEALIEKIISAGMVAPSAGDERPWHFIVVDDRKLLTGISEFHQYGKMLPDAPVAIIVCADLSLVKYEGCWPLDCSAATENMLIRAADLKLGAVWLALYPVEERVTKTKAILGLAETIIPFAIVPIGYPAEKRKPSERFDKARIHFNKW